VVLPGLPSHLPLHKYYFMKQVIGIIIILLFAGELKAQLGVSGGVSFTNYRMKKSGAKQSRDPLISYNFGMVYRTHGKGFCFQPGVDYSVKGARNYDTPLSGDVEYYNNKLNYLQFTLPIIKTWYFAKGCSLDMGIGPYLSTLMKGTSKAVYYDGTSKTNKFKIGSSSTDDFKLMDGGLTFLCGGKLSHVGMYLIYDLGLTNTTPTKNETIRNRAFRMNMVIYF
jgi:Outer membrane protein beta-barrel domain